MIMKRQDMIFYLRGKGPGDSEEIAPADYVFRVAFRKVLQAWLRVGLFKKLPAPFVNDTKTNQLTRYEINLTLLKQRSEKGNAAFPNIFKAIDAMMIWDAKVPCAMDYSAAKSALTPYIQ